jgi:hypothetical protein
METLPLIIYDLLLNISFLCVLCALRGKDRRVMDIF